MSHPDPDRRRVLRLLGGGALALALPACAPIPEDAIEAWSRAGTGDDLRRRLLSYALLAPNPHNLQPWIADLRREGEITLHTDTARALPMTDPHGRQILIGHGAFLELLSLAAAANGARADIRLFPDGAPGPERLDDRPVARVALTQVQVARDPLFDQILRRATCKKPFDPVPVPADKLAALAQAAAREGVRVDGTQDPARVSRLNDIMVRAWEIEQDTPRTWLESVDLTRVGADEIRRHRDGISLGGPMMEALRLAGQMSREKALDRQSSYFAAGKKRVRDWVPNTGSWLWLATAAGSRAAEVESGRAFVRLQLKAAELGLVTQPPSQVLQEYPEMQALQREFEALAGQRPGEKVQMLVRVGVRAAGEARSPRRPLGDILRA